MNYFLVCINPAFNGAAGFRVGSIGISASGHFHSPYPYHTFSDWPSFYAYFQTLKNGNTFQLLNPDGAYVGFTGGTFQIRQENGQFTLMRTHTNGQYVVVLEADNLQAIVERLQLILVNGTDDHKAAITKLDIQTDRCEL
ncbi:MAG: hypothetical protein U0X91_30975 [Spirosomataceae bacterium]